MLSDAPGKPIYGCLEHLLLAPPTAPMLWLSSSFQLRRQRRETADEGRWRIVEWVEVLPAAGWLTDGGELCRDAVSHVDVTTFQLRDNVDHQAGSLHRTCMLYIIFTSSKW